MIWKYGNCLETNLRPLPGSVFLRKHILVVREDSYCLYVINSLPQQTTLMYNLIHLLQRSMLPGALEIK